MQYGTGNHETQICMYHQNVDLKFIQEISHSTFTLATELLIMTNTKIFVYQSISKRQILSKIVKKHCFKPFNFGKTPTIK